MKLLSRQSLFVYALTLVLSACGSNSSDSSSEAVVDDPSNTMQSAMGTTNSEASASEGGAVGLEAFDQVSNPNDVHTLSVCSYSGARSACTGSGTTGSDTVTWNSCSVDSSRGTLTGGWSEVFSGNPSAATCTTPVVSGETVTRTSTGSVLTLASGATLTTDTSGGTAWDTTVIPSTGTTASGTGPRTIVINGTHKILRGPKGRTWFEHYITSTGLTIGGTTRATRTASGSVTVYHQLLKYTATNTLHSLAWSAGCCYPTSGNITTTFAGSQTGGATLDFTPGATTCGQATYTNPSGTVSTITLNQCN